MHRALIIFFTILIGSSAYSQIANSYLNDIGIENDPDVLYVEKFDDGLASVTSRYDEVKNAAGMSLDPDVPPGSKDPYSIKMTNVGGTNSGGHLYKRFVPGFDSVVYLRYYVKYPSESKGYIHHEGVWIGGYNPSLAWPHPRAGTCGLGDARISIAYEPVGKETMNTYMYWGDMRHDPNNNCWGNVMILGDSVASPVPYDQWLCVEIMVRLNDPVTSYNGELRIWHDGKEVGYWGPGFPRGSWTWDKFIIRDTAPPYEGFRWRTDAKLNLNWIWIEFYDDTSPAGVSHHIKYDHIVIARKRIGPIHAPAEVSSDRAQDKLSIYPNPVNSTLTVEATKAVTRIDIYDMLGKKILSDKRHELDVSSLPSGIYVLEAITEGTVLRRAFVKR